MRLMAGLCPFAAVLLSLAAVPAAAASGIEGTHTLANMDILYMEARPNASDKGTERGKLREIYKRVDPVADTLSESESRQAEKLAFENGFLEMPHPLYDALIQALAAYHVKVNPDFFSSLRSTEQTGRIRKQLASKYARSAGKADFVLSLLPYQATLTDPEHSVVWIGVWLKDQHTNTSNVYYVTVPFSKDRHGFNEADGKRTAAIVIRWLREKGVISQTD